MRSATHYGLPLPAWREQMEPGGASTFLLYQSDLEGEAVLGICETVVNLIGATRTKTGLRVKAILHINEYETGIEVSKELMAGLAIRRHVGQGHLSFNSNISILP